MNQDAEWEWREQIGQRVLLMLTCNHGAVEFGTRSVCAACWELTQRLCRLIEDERTNVIPRDILTTLFRALVYADRRVVTREQIETAWAFLEQHNHFEEMGQ